MKHTKRILSMFLALLLLALSVPPSLAASTTVASGYCGSEWVDGTYGKNLKWTLNDKGVLTISGKGKMDDTIVIPSGAESVKKIMIKDGVTSISSYAFFNFTSVKSVSLPDSLVSIGEEAFGSCEKLTSITIPAKVKTIGKNAFSYCKSLEKISVSSKNKYFSSDKYGCLYNKGKTTLLRFPIASPKTKFTVPKTVKKIGYSAFENCCNLVKIRLPKNLKTISSYAFNSCYDLKKINLPNKLKTIGEYAFGACEDLKTIKISSGVKNIDCNSFSYCQNLKAFSVDTKNKYFSAGEDGCLYNKDKTMLIRYPAGNRRTEYTIAKSVKTIEEEAFSYSYFLESITIPSNVETIWNNAFSGCDFTSVVIENGVNYFGEGVFSSCHYLKKITLPSSLAIINRSTFMYCDSLTTVNIPASITRIKESAFDSCDALKAVNYTGTKAQWNNITIEGYNEPLLNAKIHCNG